MYIRFMWEPEMKIIVVTLDVVPTPSQALGKVLCTGYLILSSWQPLLTFISKKGHRHSRKVKWLVQGHTFGIFELRQALLFAKPDFLSPPTLHLYSTFDFSKM